MEEEGSLTRSAADTYIEEPKICGHKIKTKICAFLLTGIFCIVAGGIMMIVGIVGHEGHMVGILGTLIVVLGIVALSFSLSMYCCRRKNKKPKYQSTPIVKRGMQKNDFKKLNEQSEPMMKSTAVNEVAGSKIAPNDEVNDDDDLLHDVTDTRDDRPLTPSTTSAAGKRSSSTEHSDGKRTSKASTHSLTQTEMV